jgi:hypothetical protein
VYVPSSFQSTTTSDSSDETDPSADLLTLI